MEEGVVMLDIKEKRKELHGILVMVVMVLFVCCPIAASPLNDEGTCLVGECSFVAFRIPFFFVDTMCLRTKSFGVYWFPFTGNFY